MLRMGRGPKTEPTASERKTNEPAAGERTNAAAHATHHATTQQPTASVAARQTTQQLNQTSAPPTPPAAAEKNLTPKAQTEAESLAREIKEGAVSGFVGGSTVLTGEVVFKGMLRVDGRVAGGVRSEKGTLIVSSGGRVEADVEVAVARVGGTVEGDIRASERVELGRTARVFGNIQTPSLAIEQGAFFEGLCRMKQGAAAATPRRETKAEAMPGAATDASGGLTLPPERSKNAATGFTSVSERAG